MASSRTVLAQDFAEKETDATAELESSRTARCHALSTEKWVSLAGFTQRFPTLLDRLLALKAMAGSRGVRPTDGDAMWGSAG